MSTELLNYMTQYLNFSASDQYISKSIWAIILVRINRDQDKCWLLLYFSFICTCQVTGHVIPNERKCAFRELAVFVNSKNKYWRADFAIDNAELCPQQSLGQFFSHCNEVKTTNKSWKKTLFSNKHKSPEYLKFNYNSHFKM